MKEKDIKEFWHNNPCGELGVGTLAKYGSNYLKFFDDYDKYRYELEDHIFDCLDALNLNGKKVLEIGLGQGADSEQIIRRGGLWSGVDLTEESIRRVSLRLQLKKLDYDEVKQGSALELPFEDNSFDLVYSHGVLHHIPDIKQAQKEISRVLKPDGELVAMFYAKNSMNYQLSIKVLRRLGLIAMYFLRVKGGGKYRQHVELAKEIGLGKYLRISNFIHRNTDGPYNVYSKVYTPRIAAQDFTNFDLVKSYKKFMYAPPLPVKRLCLGGFMGWHLWIHFKPKK